jgi:hypothetical protein
MTHFNSDEIQAAISVAADNGVLVDGRVVPSMMMESILAAAWEVRGRGDSVVTEMRLQRDRLIVDIQKLQDEYNTRLRDLRTTEGELESLRAVYGKYESLLANTRILVESLEDAWWVRAGQALQDLKALVMDGVVAAEDAGC